MCMRWLRKLYLQQSGLERISPNDWVKRDQIDYDGGLLTIKLKPNVKVFGIADTGSMDGLLDYGHNVIATDHFDKAKLAVGDIVVYQVYTTRICHRIIEIREDRNGRIYRCRGDNCIDTDKWYLRDENIKWLVLGIIY
ncbi:unnamed protein product [marine sediment metagenome]|uniref:Peptidase S24/S26A/S26B/S26C domain-containing protein n=1 Tax=marine sediment metagenome TaxID=412755 RepID=X1FPF5_9ZZZZ